MWVHDPASGRILAVNRATEKLLGRTRGELLAMTVSELGSTERDRMYTLDISTRDVAFGGSRADLSVAKDASRGLDGEPDLPSLRAWFRRTMDGIGDGVVMLDNAWHFDYVNAEAERILARTRKELLGRVLWDAFPRFLGSPAEEALRRAMDGGESTAFEILHPAGQGWLSARVHRTIGGIAVFFRDVTERRKGDVEIRESEERFRNIARVTADALWDWDLVTGAYWWGLGIHAPADLEMADLGPDFDSWVERIHPGDRERVLGGIREVIEGGRGEWETEYAFRLGNGRFARFLDRGFVMRDDEGSPLRMVGGARDITERQNAQERIQFQASLLEAVGQAAIATDEDGRIVYWNAAAERTYGWSADEVLGRPIIEVTLKTTGAAEGARIMDVLLGGEPWAGELDVQRKDGSTFQAQITNSPIFDQDGRLRGVIGISSDATDRKEFDRRLRQAQKMEAVGRLAGGIAHDFNNVLTVILGRSRLLLDEMSPDSPLREDVSQIITASQRAASLTSRLLAFSRSQVLQERIVDLSAAATEMEGLLRPLVPTRISIHYETSPGEAVVRVDPIQLQQVLLNLSINARDAMPGKGSLTFRVETRSFDERDVAEMPWEMAPGRYAVLSVEDTGTGIPTELLDRIFEPFFTTKPEGQGTGLGLSMVYGMMKQSRGFVMVESELGKGSAFRLLFPSVDEVADPILKPSAAPLGRATDRARVLIVEDDPGVGGIVTRVLERAGHIVLHAIHGREALERMEADPKSVDIVISDVVMPEMSGAEFVQVLKERGHLHPVILVSGFSEEELSRAARSEAAAFLRKPFSPEELTRAVAEVLRR